MLDERPQSRAGVLGLEHGAKASSSTARPSASGVLQARVDRPTWPGPGPPGGPPPARLAQARAASSTSSGAATRLTSPMESASSARTWRPERISSLARDDPIRRGRRWVPPPPGITPRRISGRPSRASSAQTRKSQASASSSPPPRAKPLTAAMVARGSEASAPRARPKFAADRPWPHARLHLGDVRARREDAPAAPEHHRARQVGGQSARPPRPAGPGPRPRARWPWAGRAGPGPRRRRAARRSRTAQPWPHRTRPRTGGPHSASSRSAAS